MNTPLHTDDSIVYGQLIVLGTNGQLPGGDKGRRRSCFTLKKKIKHSGVKPSDFCQVLQQASHSKAFSSKEQHSVMCSCPCHRHVFVVSYIPDADTDMFQIGRSSEEQNDFVVMDILPGASFPINQTDLQPQLSSISRFACRIVCNRDPLYTARIYAAGFNNSKNIILEEKAPKWIKSRNGKKLIDGLKTNGVLIMKPQNGFTHQSEVTHWKEVSVCGEIYLPRESRSAQKPGAKIENDDNVLVNGTLIDLCGVTLLWRLSGNQESCMPTPHQIEQIVQDINKSRPHDPVGLTTLAFPKCSQTPQETEKQPWVYLECGHIKERIDWSHQGKEERVG